MIFKDNATGVTTTIPPTLLVHDSHGFFTLLLDFSTYQYPKYQQWDIEASTVGSTGPFIYILTATISFKGINIYNIDPTKPYWFRHRLKSRSEISEYSQVISAGQTILD